jgi:hypothetical protein
MKPAPKAVDPDKYEEQKKRRAAYRYPFAEIAEAPVEEPPARSKSLKERMTTKRSSEVPDEATGTDTQSSGHL